MKLSVKPLRPDSVIAHRRPLALHDNARGRIKPGGTRWLRTGGGGSRRAAAVGRYIVLVTDESAATREPDRLLSEAQKLTTS